MKAMILALGVAVFGLSGTASAAPRQAPHQHGPQHGNRGHNHNHGYDQHRHSHPGFYAPYRSFGYPVPVAPYRYPAYRSQPGITIGLNFGR